MAVIYRIRHVARGLAYVGSTIKQKRRFADHLAALRSGRHTCRHLQRLWSKDGEAAFIIEVLEKCADADRYDREQWWMDNSNSELNQSREASYAGILLDVSPANKPGWVPTHRIGVKDTPETIEQRRASRLATEAARREHGLLYVWVTNGTNDQKILSTDAIPEGWRVGRKPSFAEQARTNRAGETRDDDARENMRQAQLASNAARREAGQPHHNAGVQQAYCWITDGVNNLRQLKTAPIPDGYRRGRTFSRY